MKYSSMNTNIQNATNEQIKERWLQLSTLVNILVESIWKYLFLVNSGSAVALLGFMGAKETLYPFPAALCALAYLVSGVVLVGVGYALNYYRFVYLASKWRNESIMFFNDQICWEDLINKDKKRSKYFFVADLIAWMCFLCFLNALFVVWRNISVI